MSGSSRLSAAAAALAPSSSRLPQTPVPLTPITPALPMAALPTPEAPLTPGSFATFLDQALSELPNNSEIPGDQNTPPQPSTTKKRRADETFPGNPAASKRAMTSATTSSSSADAQPAHEDTDKNFLNDTVATLEQMYQVQLEAEKRRMADQLSEFKAQSAAAEKIAIDKRRELVRKIRARDKEIEERREIEIKLKAERDSLEKQNQALLETLEEKKEEVENLKQASAAAQFLLWKKQRQISEQARFIDELKQSSKDFFSAQEVFAVINALQKTPETPEEQLLAIQTLAKVNATVAEQRGINFFPNNPSRVTAAARSNSGNRGVNLAPPPSLSAGSRT